MRGQVLLGAAIVIFLVTLILLLAIPKRTLGPTLAAENYTLAKREVEHILRNAAEEAAFSTGKTLEALLLGENDDLATALARYYKQIFNITFYDKAGAYAALRGIYCRLDQLEVETNVETNKDANTAYISSIYAVAKCNNGITAFLNIHVDLKAAFVNLGAFGGLDVAVKLYKNQEEILLINYAAALYNKTDNMIYRIPIMGTFDIKEAMWYFNISALHYIKLAIPPEFCTLQQPNYYITVVATSVGQGAATVAIIKPMGKICGS